MLLINLNDYDFQLLLQGHKHATSFFEHKFWVNVSVNTLFIPKTLGDYIRRGFGSVSSLIVPNSSQVSSNLWHANDGKNGGKPD